MTYSLYTTFYTGYLVLCICYAYDLYITIKNPLYPVGKRLRIYICSVIFSWIVVWIISVSGEFNQDGHMADSALNDRDFINDIAEMKQLIFEERIIWKIALIVPLTIFVIVGIVSITKAIISFKQPGLGQEVRKTVIQR